MGVVECVALRGALLVATVVIAGCSVTFDPTGTLSGNSRMQSGVPPASSPYRDGASGQYRSSGAVQSRAYQNPRPVPAVARGGDRAYGGGQQAVVVMQGETLHSISRVYGVSVERLMDLNGLRSTHIVPGQRLYVR